MKKVKITVLKTTLDEELAREYGADGLGPCPMLRAGQVFYGIFAGGILFIPLLLHKFSIVCQQFLNHSSLLLSSHRGVLDHRLLFRGLQLKDHRPQPIVAAADGHTRPSNPVPIVK